MGRLPSLDRSKSDVTTDGAFYARPNLVTHTDDAFLSQLTALYDELLPPDGVILDMMSSHVSHLPGPKLRSGHYRRVDVHGMNEEELMANDARRTTGGDAFVRNLNDNPSFVGLADTGTYDCVLCCVGVQYLEEPEQVFAEVARILKPTTGVCIVSFTNRFFYQKALVGWMERGMRERARLVKDSTAQHSTAQHSRCLCIQNYIKLTCIKRPYDRTVVVPNKKGERKISQVKINQTQTLCFTLY